MMNSEEHDLYWRPACKKMEFPYKGNKDPDFIFSQKLARLLGLHYPEVAFWREIELTDELKNKLRAIAGPYGEIMIRVLELRRD
jgi:hypothetical protein